MWGHWKQDIQFMTGTCAIYLILTFRKSVAVLFAPDFFKWAIPASFLLIFSLFKQTLQFLNKSMGKNVHPLYDVNLQPSERDPRP